MFNVYHKALRLSNTSGTIRPNKMMYTLYHTTRRDRGFKVYCL